jgi:hypothetical protein
MSNGRNAVCQLDLKRSGDKRRFNLDAVTASTANSIQRRNDTAIIIINMFRLHGVHGELKALFVVKDYSIINQMLSELCVM